MSGWYQRLNLWQKLIIYILPIVIIPIGIVTIVIVTQWTDDLRDGLIATEDEHLESIKDNIESLLDIPERDIRILAQSDNVAELARALRVNDNLQIGLSVTRLQNDFIALANSTVVNDPESEDLGQTNELPLYSQIRFIDSSGDEIVRVDREYNIESEAFVVQDLQNKQSREYFVEGSSLLEGEVYVSPFELNREGTPAEIQVREDGSLVPVVRYATPVYVNTTFVGVIVINVFGDSVEEMLHTRINESEILMLNADGYFLFNSIDPSLEFGFEDGIEAITGMSDADITDSDFFTTEEAQLVLGSRETFSNRFYESDNGFFVNYSTVRPGSASRDYSWYIITATDQSVLFSDVNRVTTLGLIAMAGVIAATGFALFLISQQITRPIRELSGTVQRMASGDLTTSPDDTISKRGDEIGDLSKSFNAMAGQLLELFTSMEERIQARTNDLEASAEISGAANQVRNLEDLLSLTVNLIRDRFNFYYTQVYMIDEAGRYAVLREGTGFVGRKLLGRNHRLPLDGRSLVAQAIQRNEAVVVQDTEADPNFLSNELLPDTRSEVAVPLHSQERIIGVLDIQHNVVNAFTPETIRLFQTMADQLGVTFDNVNLLEDTRQRALELETVAQVGAEATSNLDMRNLLFEVSNLVKERFNLYHAHIYLMNEDQSMLVLTAGAGEAGQEMVAEERAIPVSTPQSLVARAARERNGIVVNDTIRDPNFLPHPFLPNTRSEMAVPMVIGDNVVGVLDVQSDRVNSFSDDDVRIQSTLAAQVAVAVQNARSFELTEKRARELATVAEVSANIATNLDLQTLLADVAELTAQGFDLYHLHLYLLQPDGETLLLVAGTGQVACQHVGKNYTVNIKRDDNTVTQAANMKRGVIENQVDAETHLESNPYLPDTRSQIAVPLVISDRVVGVLEAHSNRYNGFSDNDIQTQMTLASQVAIAIQNARSFELTEKRALELQTVAEVSAQASASLDLQKLLFDVSNLVKERFNLYHAHVYLMNDEGDKLVLTGGAGEAGRAMVAEERIIRVAAKQSIVATAAREKTTRIANDVIREPTFLPHPLLPKTRSEMAVPLIVGGEVLGVLDVQSNRKNHFTDEDVRIQTTLAAQVAIAIQNARSFELTQKRALELQTVAEVSTQASTNLDLARLLTDVSNLVKERFNLYHAHIYLMEEDHERLVLAGGAGKAGSIMVQERRSISMGSQQSIVASAARSRTGQVVNDVTLAEDFLPNPLLPATRSEMAVPMIVGDDVVGVLDVQSDMIQRFTPDDVSVMTTLTSQVAVAVQNARSFLRTQEALDLASILYTTSQALISMGSVDGLLMAFVEPIMVNDGAAMLSYVVRDSQGRPQAFETVATIVLSEDEKVIVPEIGTKLPMEMLQFVVDDSEAIVMVSDIVNDTQMSEADRSTLLENNIEAICVLPLTDNTGEAVGMVTLYWSHPHSVTDDQLQLMRVLGPQVTTIMENGRLFVETEQSRIRSETIAGVNASLSSAQDEFDILSSVAVYTQQTNPVMVSLAYIMVDDDGNPSASETVAVWMGGQIVEEAPELYRTEKVDDNSLSQAWINSPGEPVFVEDIRESDVLPDVLRDRMLEGGIYSFLLMPLRSGGEWQGFIFSAWGEPHTFTDEEQMIYRNLINSTSAVVAGRRALMDSIRRANELATVAEVSAATTTILNVENLLQSVSELTRESFNLYHAQVYLVYEEKGALVLVGSSGDAGRFMLERNHSIALSERHSTVVSAFREQRGIIINDVRTDPAFLPNPLLPSTRSELAVPLMIGNEVIGVLDVQSRTLNRFTEDDVRVQSVLASQIAIAVQNALSFAEIERQAERERRIAEQLREVDRLKSQFLANMSHELRTPLNSIIGYSEVLLDGVDGDLTEDAEEDVQAIHDSGKHLLSIINEILDLAKIEAGEMHLDLREVDVAGFAREIAKTGQVLTKNKPVVLEVVEETEMPTVCADPVRLRQILWNLMSNALKFTEEGSVRVHLNMYDDKHALITVRDSGIGMSEEGLQLIFQRFSQVDGSSTRRAGGTGLGLTITKQLIEMHGGEIHVESTFGVGSTFWFTIPVFEAETVQEA